MGTRKTEKKAQEETAPLGFFESYIEIGKKGHYPLFFDGHDHAFFTAYLDRPKLSKLEIEKLISIFDELAKLESFNEQKKFFERLGIEHKNFLVGALVKAVEEDILDQGPTLH